MANVTWGYSKLKWSRNKCNKWIRAKRCPECKGERLSPGPDYDRFLIVCWDCGFRFRAKPPRKAVREKYRKLLVH